MKSKVMQMQKVRKIVINSVAFLVIVLFNNNYGYTQTIKEDYILLNKVIEFNSKLYDSTFLLLENTCFSKEEMEKYYRHNFLKEKNIVEIIGYKYDENGKRVPDYLTKEIRSEFQEKWYSSYKGLDSILTQQDFENLFAKNDTIKWKEKELSKRIKLINSKEVILDIGGNFTEGNKISKPLYSLNKKYAILQYKTPITPYVLYIFKKEKNEWVKVGLIKQHF